MIKNSINFESIKTYERINAKKSLNTTLIHRIQEDPQINMSIICSKLDKIDLMEKQLEQLTQRE